jgi:hypothetical protein
MSLGGFAQVFKSTGLKLEISMDISAQEVTYIFELGESSLFSSASDTSSRMIRSQLYRTGDFRCSLTKQHVSNLSVIRQTEGLIGVS